MIPPPIDPAKLQPNLSAFIRELLGGCPMGKGCEEQRVTSKKTAEKAKELVRDHFENPLNPKSGYRIIDMQENCGSTGCDRITVSLEGDGKTIVRELEGVELCREPDGRTELYAMGRIFRRKVQLEDER